MEDREPYITGGSKVKTRELGTLLKEIEDRKNAIAKERNKLRDVFHELAHLIDRFDEGIEGLQEGKARIEEGIESISEVV